MISFMKVFTNIQSFNNDTADAITDQEVKSTQIETIQVDLNDQLLEIIDVYYILNIISNLLSTDLLEKQKFDFNLILKTNYEKQFKITDTEDQIFHAIKITFNIYKIVAIKAKSEFKANQKFKEKFKEKLTTDKKDNKLKLSQLIY